ncbi:MAG: hypothetical protein LBU14_05710 [Candidatus Peribacteria bacterium]|jgi:hypothetical protein|nr:hypothetical protein [Candidatus Peribacteria bacterium]
MTKDLWIFNIIKPVPTLLFLIFTLMIAVYFFSNLRSKNKIKNLSDLAKK